jgi:molybdopterin converting factor small subunit
LPTKTLEPSSTKLLAIEEKSVTESADKPQENAGDQKENTSDRQARLKAQIERMRRHLKSGTPALVTVAKNWIKSHSDIVALVDGDIVDLMPPDP